MAFDARQNVNKCFFKSLNELSSLIIIIKGNYEY
jgi:hypothetical protein